MRRLSTVLRVTDDIPPPVEATTPDYGKRKYPWYEMKVGDSFWVKGKTTAQIAASYAQVQRKTDMLFTARREGAGARCWRIRLVVGGLGLAFAMTVACAQSSMTRLTLPELTADHIVRG